MQITKIWTDEEGVNLRLRADNEPEVALLALLDNGGVANSFNREKNTLVLTLPVEEREGHQ